jgi:uncharacterized membrane protein YdjX (TVP38/TMEM64 family)
MQDETEPSQRLGLVGGLRRFGPLALIVLVVIAALASGALRHLSLEELQARHATLQALVRSHPFLSLGAYLGVYILVVSFSLPAALVMTLTGGLLFGPWAGGFAAAVGCTLGATVIFLIARTAVGDLLKRKAGPTAARIEEGVRRNAFSYIVMLRLFPVAPIWLVNLALAFVDIPLTTYVGASFLGILPPSLIYARLGSELNRLFVRGARPDPHLLLRPQLWAPLIGLALLALAPILVRRLRRPFRGWSGGPGAPTP